MGPVDSPAARVSVAAFGVRDVILGVAQIQALRRGVGARGLFRLGLLAEGVDLAVARSAQASGTGERPNLLHAVTAMGLGGGVWLSVALQDRRH